MASVKMTLNPGGPTLLDIQDAATAAGLFYKVLSPNLIDVFSSDINKVGLWKNQYITNTNIAIEYSLLHFKPRHKISNSPFPRVRATPSNTTVPWFTTSNLVSIYNIPRPNQNTPVVVGVISFGGGLYGTVNTSGVVAAGSTGAGILTNGDVQAYWSWLGITNIPKVIVVPIGTGATAAKNTPDINDGGATIENTMDIEIIGGTCPSAKLTIILYIAVSKSYDDFNTIITYIKNTNITVAGSSYKPTIISCSWGIPEYYVQSSPTAIANTNTLLQAITNPAAGTKVINVCTATGDYGSNDGVGGYGSYVDFPSSCPYVTAVGGTSLICPNNIYDGQTTETVWPGSGGGESISYPKPAWQSGSAFTNMIGRSVPDIASLADPNTGVVVIINRNYLLVGGTSVSAPTIAGYLASVNCSVFFTPKLYSMLPTSFHDITIGNNGNFSANTGYDNCTGFGTINGNVITNGIISQGVTSISLTPSSGISIIVGQTLQISANVLPANATNKVILWTSSNPLQAAVVNGLVTAISPGSVTINATSTDGTNVTASIPVTITGQKIYVASVALNVFIQNVRVGATVQLNSRITPANATNQNIVWVSSSPSVATVNSSGLVRGIASGTTYILVNSVDGNKTTWAKINVTLTANILVRITDISIDPQITILAGAHFLLVPTINPVTATTNNLSWNSSDLSIATIDQSGLVSALNSGTTIITVTSIDGLVSAQCTVTVP